VFILFEVQGSFCILLPLPLLFVLVYPFSLEFTWVLVGVPCLEGVRGWEDYGTGLYCLFLFSSRDFVFFFMLRLYIYSNADKLRLVYFCYFFFDFGLLLLSTFLVYVLGGTYFQV
jgi:hypothetical protein